MSVNGDEVDDNGRKGNEFHSKGEKFQSPRRCFSAKGEEKQHEKKITYGIAFVGIVLK